MNLSKKGICIPRNNFYNKALNVVNATLLKTALDNFWNTKALKIKPNHHIAIIVKFYTNKGAIRTIADLTKVNITNEHKHALYKYLLHNLNVKQSGYEDLIITEILFSYGIIEGPLLDPYIYNEEKKVVYFNYSHYMEFSYKKLHYFT